MLFLNGKRNSSSENKKAKVRKAKNIVFGMVREKEKIVFGITSDDWLN